MGTEVQNLSMAMARAIRDEGPNSARLAQLHRDMAAAKLAARIRKALAEGPPLDREQRNRLAILLLDGDGS